MIPAEINRATRPARVLLFSHRNIYDRAVWRCSFHEFENLLETFESVDVVAPRPTPWYRNGKRLALRLGEHVKASFNPGIEPVAIKKDYDVFFAVCEKASELLNINAIKGWKEHCRTSVCLVTEFYVNEIPTTRSCLEMLRKFDYVLLMFSAIAPFQKVLDGKGSYIAPAVDALRFCPYPDMPARCIDVLSIGRRSETTHQALLRLAREQSLFYVYDTIDSLDAYNLDEHRALFANRAKRSRYFIANAGKINRPDETGGQSEFGYRYFEGAAAGAIMIGERPRNREFDRIFHWEDALIDLPFGSGDVGAIMRELDRDPERQMRIRRNNISEALLHHDWVWRWEEVLQMANLAPTVAMERRKDELRKAADLVRESEYQAAGQFG